MAQVSPLVTNLSWGSISVQAVDAEGQISPTDQVQYRDVKLWPGGSRGWDWRETGTSHRPGIQPADVKELLAHKPDTMILSRGVLLVLQVPQSTLDYVQKELPGMEINVENSKSAYQTYNTKAKEGKRVAALIHSTC